jgi:hypothetical protein
MSKSLIYKDIIAGRYCSITPCSRGHICERTIARACIECLKLTNRKWKTNNIERHRELNAKSYRADKSHKDRAIEAAKRWKTKNISRVNSDTANRRSTKLNATPLWADMETIRDFYAEAKYFQMEVDHIIPLRSNIVCGLHCEANLQLLTAIQNQAKGNKLPIDWE